MSVKQFGKFQAIHEWWHCETLYPCLTLHVNTKLWHCTTLPHSHTLCLLYLHHQNHHPILIYFTLWGCKCVLYTKIYIYWYFIELNNTHWLSVKFLDSSNNITNNWIQIVYFYLISNTSPKMIIQLISKKFR